MLAATRSFFRERDVLEVDTDILQPFAPVDAHIDVMEIDKVGYLHTSPEYAMKKLLAQGSGDIFQLSHVFRLEEEGALHTSEFTLLEWYRVGMSYWDFIEETLELIRLFLPKLPAEILTYREAFLKYSKIDYLKDPLDVSCFNKEACQWPKDTQLDLIFSHVVEPHLGQEKLTVITDYPPSKAALAKKMMVHEEQIARRFEVYYNGIELANGYDELADSVEQRFRLEQENRQRKLLGKKEFPMDEEFLAALDHLPECCGVAVGFDRLMMLI